MENSRNGMMNGRKPQGRWIDGVIWSKVEAASNREERIAERPARVDVVDLVGMRPDLVNYIRQLMGRNGSPASLPRLPAF
jgi:hypothetical protein